VNAEKPENMFISHNQTGGHNYKNIKNIIKTEGSDIIKHGDN
jgi:hypothetical protein